MSRESIYDYQPDDVKEPDDEELDAQGIPTEPGRQAAYFANHYIRKNDPGVRDLRQKTWVWNMEWKWNGIWNAKWNGEWKWEAGREKNHAMTFRTICIEKYSYIYTC